MAKNVIVKTFECLLATATLAGLFALCWLFFGLSTTCILAGIEVVFWLWLAYECRNAPVIQDIATNYK